MIIEMRQENPFGSTFFETFIIFKNWLTDRQEIRIVLGEQVVAAIYRYSSSEEWRSKCLRGGKAEKIKIT